MDCLVLPFGVKLSVPYCGGSEKKRWLQMGCALIISEGGTVGSRGEYVGPILPESYRDVCRRAVEGVSRNVVVMELLKAVESGLNWMLENEQHLRYEFLHWDDFNACVHFLHNEVAGGNLSIEDRVKAIEDKRYHFNRVFFQQELNYLEDEG